MTPIYKIKTAKYFDTDDEPPAEEDIEEWPPFRRVGEFDPYSDDPRLGIRRIDICKQTGALLVGGTAGQVNGKIFREKSKISEINLMSY